MTNGVLKGVEHFDSKAEVAEYIETTKGDMTATYFMPGFYMQNIKGMIRPGRDGVPTLIQPWDGDKTKVALLGAATDSGTDVAGILSQDPQSVNGVYVQACSEWITPNEMVDVLSKTSGTKVKFQQVPEGVFKCFLPPARRGRDGGEHGPGERLQLFRARARDAPARERQDPGRDEEDDLGGVCHSKWALDVVYGGSSSVRPLVVRALSRYFPHGWLRWVVEIRGSLDFRVSCQLIIVNAFPYLSTRFGA